MRVTARAARRRRRQPVRPTADRYRRTSCSPTLDGRPLWRHSLDHVLAAGFDARRRGHRRGADRRSPCRDRGAVASSRSCTTRRGPTGRRPRCSSAVAAARRARHRGHRRRPRRPTVRPGGGVAGGRRRAAPTCTLVVATYDGVGPESGALRRRALAQLPTDGDEGARGLMRRSPRLGREVACEGSAADIDTLEDLAAMDKLLNEFTVNRPIDETWKVLTDVERIAPCMPGAQLAGDRGRRLPRRRQGQARRDLHCVQGSGQLRRARRRRPPRRAEGRRPRHRRQGQRRRADHRHARERRRRTSPSASSRPTCTSPARSPSSAGGSWATSARS